MRLEGEKSINLPNSIKRLEFLVSVHHGVTHIWMGIYEDGKYKGHRNRYYRRTDGKRISQLTAAAIVELDLRVHG